MCRRSFDTIWCTTCYGKCYADKLRLYTLVCIYIYIRIPCFVFVGSLPITSSDIMIHTFRLTRLTTRLQTFMIQPAVTFWPSLPTIASAVCPNVLHACCNLKQCLVLRAGEFVSWLLHGVAGVCNAAFTKSHCSLRHVLCPLYLIIQGCLMNYTWLDTTEIIESSE